jgi:hypothetical protein
MFAQKECQILLSCSSIFVLDSLVVSSRYVLVFETSGRILASNGASEFSDSNFWKLSVAYAMNV